MYKHAGVCSHALRRISLPAEDAAVMLQLLKRLAAMTQTKNLL